MGNTQSEDDQLLRAESKNNPQGVPDSRGETKKKWQRRKTGGSGGKEEGERRDSGGGKRVSQTRWPDGMGLRAERVKRKAL